jgi:ABC-type branched-subunit amino acid transport system ATPase component
VTPVLQVERLSAGYGAAPVLEDVSLEVASGSLTLLVGSNGAGKTTLLSAIAGLLPCRGTVRLDGVALGTAGAPERVRRGLSLVPEGRQLFPHLPVRDNLLLGAYLAARPQRGARLRGVLGAFPRLEERQRQLAGTMSGGEQQLVAIARALMNAPRLLLLDEPSLGLAPRLVAELFRTVRQICDHGTAVLLVEQNVRQALAIADRGYVLERGRIVAQGAGRELLGSPRVREAYLGTL